MTLYAYYDDTTSSGIRAFTAWKVARSARAKQFTRPKRPELFAIYLGTLTHQKAADLLTGNLSSFHVVDIA